MGSQAVLRGARGAAAHAVRRRCYSHGPTVGQMYGEYRKIDELLTRLRPDLLGDTQQVDELLARGEITPNMAAQFKHDIDASNEAKKAAEYWRRVFWYVGVPLTLLVGLNTYYVESAHAAHLREHPHEIVPYPHLRIRTKKFFWGDGDHTLFHNPEANGR